MPFTYTPEPETSINPFDGTSEDVLHVCVETVNGKNANECYVFPAGTPVAQVEQTIHDDLVAKGYQGVD